MTEQETASERLNRIVSKHASALNRIVSEHASAEEAVMLAIQNTVRELEEQRRRAAEAEALAAAFRRAANQIGNLRAAFIGLGVAFEHAAACHPEGVREGRPVGTLT